MSNIKNIQGNIAGLTPQKNAQKSEKSGKDFGADLEKQVAKLEQMGSEIDKMVSSEITDPNSVQNNVKEVGRLINNMAGIMDDLSGTSADKSEHRPSAQHVVNQYGRMAKKPVQGES